jgi:hypothetical protein
MQPVVISWEPSSYQLLHEFFNYFEEEIPQEEKNDEFSPLDLLSMSPRRQLDTNSNRTPNKTSPIYNIRCNLFNAIILFPTANQYLELT